MLGTDAAGTGDQVVDSTTGGPIDDGGDFGTTVEPDSQGDTSASVDDSSATTPAGDPAAAGQPQPSAQPDDLLTPQEYEALKNNPDALRHALNRNYTQKMQELAPWRNFRDAYNRDARAAVTTLARQLGIPIAEDPQSTAAKASTVDARSEILAKVEAAFGPEGAQALLPLLNNLVEHATLPARQTIQQLQEQTAMNEVRTSLDTMTKLHPDWKQFEAKMTEIGQQIQPAQGFEPVAYLETLYHLAKRDQDVADKAKAIVDRTNNSVRASEPRTRTASSSDNTPARAPRNFREAAEMAFRGETVQ